MPALKQILAIAALLVCSTGVSQDEAAEHWRRAFTLSLQGNKLEAAELNELALASYTESLRQFQFVSENYPEFQTELVVYRIEQLKKQIAEHTDLQSPEAAQVTKQFLEYLAITEQAEAEREMLRHLKSLITFKEAKAKLNTVIAINPQKYATALEQQKLLLDREVLRLNQRYVERYKKPIKTPPRSGTTYGTTRYVYNIDLPTDGGGLDSAPSLFPGR